MGKVCDLLLEAFWLWLVMAIVVTIASFVHNIVARSELQALKKRVNDQRVMPQPDDFKRPHPEEA